MLNARTNCKCRTRPDTRSFSHCKETFVFNWYDNAKVLTMLDDEVIGMKHKNQGCVSTHPSMRISSYNIIEKFNRYTKMVPDFAFPWAPINGIQHIYTWNLLRLSSPFATIFHPLKGDIDHPLNLPLCVTTLEVCGRSRVFWSSLNMSSAIFSVWCKENFNKRPFPMYVSTWNSDKYAEFTTTNIIVVRAS